MPKNLAHPSNTNSTPLQALGEQIRAQRKALRLSATVTAEAAGMSRVTLYRIEKGERSVTMGAWCDAVEALGLALQVHSQAHARTPNNFPLDRNDWIPTRIALADYPQLRALAWQVQGTDTLTPTEALDIYESNARHLDLNAMSGQEQALLRALPLALSRSALTGPSASDAV